MFIYSNNKSLSENIYIYTLLNQGFGSIDKKRHMYLIVPSRLRGSASRWDHESCWLGFWRLQSPQILLHIIPATTLETGYSPPIHSWKYYCTLQPFSLHSLSSSAIFCLPLLIPLFLVWSDRNLSAVGLINKKYMIWGGNMSLEFGTNAA